MRNGDMRIVKGYSNMLKPTWGSHSKSSGALKIMQRSSTAKATGKATEKDTAQALRKHYGINVDIQRLPDKYDVGRYEDVRPSDFLITLGGEISTDRGVSNVYYVECKETNSDKASFSFNSVFMKGQMQAMRRAKKLQIPYFVVFQFLKTREKFLVPSLTLLELETEGKKSIPVSTIRNYPWKTGALYDYYREENPESETN